MIGVDIISIARIDTFIKRFGRRGLERFLHDEERVLCGDSIDALNEAFDIKCIKISRVAGFWAAKEACAKALGVGIGNKLSFLDIHIGKAKTNAPIIWLSDDKMRIFNIKEMSLSISHDGGFAIAVVFALK